MPSERKIQTQILKWLNKQPRTVAFNIHGDSFQVGVPDIVGAHEGIPLYIEVKKPGGRISIIQEINLRKAAEAGSFSCTCTSLEEFQDQLSEYKKARGTPTG